ncbi:universal stress protein [Modestobacter sp. VKM Ac-2978]|uniref:universal stress protein n=1 Tax=Modestobacter sp. VKM Ac-2978 TaxID=3004132 RepID=UPI0022AAE7F0|nr:universal stress protein [Modestobacter sp. VKM Ac-2978]MCZ2849765.1 universal stress protein [Modestobacter sp. VKM Ac-2978]
MSVEADGSVGTDTAGDQDPADRAGPPTVVVGVDGSPGSRAALVYAITAAARRGAALEVVATFALQAVWVGGYPLGMPEVATVREELEKRVAALVAEVRGDPAVVAVPGAADVRTRLVISVGPPSQRLVDASAAADLLVVGSRGRGAVRSALLGSVALHCVTHARCPVVVVHPAAAGHRRVRTVLVGIDGSEASRVALRAGLAEAARLDAETVAVSTFEMADHWVDLRTVVVPTVDEVRWQVQSGAEAMLEDAVAEHRADHDGHAPAARAVVAEGPPADILVQWAADAELLVVGSRGHGELRGLLVGSVALACVMHAVGPVLVVHPPSDRVVVRAGQEAAAGG